MQYRSTRKSVFSVKYHVIWCPKFRRDVLCGPIQTRLKQIIGEVVAEFGGMVIEVETMPDHVHLLVELPPQVAVSKLVQILKGRSSRRLGQEFAHLARMKCYGRRPGSSAPSVAHRWKWSGGMWRTRKSPLRARGRRRSGGAPVPVVSHQRASGVHAGQALC
jgi:putative transposase